MLLLPAIAQAADITGVAKIREGDDDPDRQHPHPPRRHRRARGGSALPQRQGRALDLRRRGARRTDQTCRQQDLDLPPARSPTAAAASWRAARSTARTSRNGWSATAGRWPMRGFPGLRAGRKGRARGQGRDVAGRLHRAVGLARPQQEDRHPRRRQAAGNARAILLASASGSVAPSPDCTIKGNVNRSGECIYHQPTSRWYAKIKMNISKGTRWFCSVDEAEAAGCRETRR